LSETIPPVFCRGRDFLSALLGFLFLGDPRALPCGAGAAADPANDRLLHGNGDSGIDISDAVSLLAWRFLGGPEHALGKECRPIPGCRNGCAR
jgi:hypothetical protein